MQINIGYKTIYRSIYRIVLPILTIILLIGVSSFNNRSRLFDSIYIDLFVRLFLCYWFCGLYWKLSRFSSYSIYPNIIWKKENLTKKEKTFYIGLGILWGIGSGILTWWSVKFFFPCPLFIRYASSILNAFITSYPMAIQYWVLKL